jgi:hypothetical protein
MDVVTGAETDVPWYKKNFATKMSAANFKLHTFHRIDHNFFLMVDYDMEISHNTPSFLRLTEILNIISTLYSYFYYMMDNTERV